MSVPALNSVQLQWYGVHQCVQLCVLHGLGVCLSKLY